MVIVDKGASEKLVQALKGLTNLSGRHCIRIYPLSGNIEQVHAEIIKQVKDFLPGADMYFCEEGETYLLTHLASVKECKQAVLAIASAFKIISEKTAEIYDLVLQNSALISLLEKKIDHGRSVKEAVEKREAEEKAAAQQARKRQEILSQGVHKNAQQIAAQRALRSEPRLMIIEDDPFSRRLVENVLQKQYPLTGLSSAEDALATYADIAPDLLFLDINLPDVTGHELLEKIIVLDPKAYVVMLSGNADRNNIMQAMQHGAVGFVAKPFSREKLFQYIERCPTIHKENVP